MHKLITILLISFSIPGFANQSNGIALNLLYFDYEEFDLSGLSLDKETGFIPGLSFNTHFNRNEIDVSIYGGTVDYDGHTQAMTSHKTTTDQTLYQAGYKYHLDAQPSSPNIHYLFGLTYHYWSRHIQPQGNVYGLKETYTWLQLGAGFETTLYSTNKHDLLLELGLLHTFNGKITIDLNSFGFGHPELNLGSKPGLEGKIKWTTHHNQHQNIELGIGYNYWEFGRSNSKTLNNGFQTITIEEPRSKSNHILFFLGFNHLF